MRTLGQLLTAVGVIWLFIAFNMDTSVSTGGGPYMPSRVENIGLIAERQNHLYVSGLLTLLGVLAWIFGEKATGSNTEVTKDEGLSVSYSEPSVERDLSSDAYCLWLAKKYNVERNDVFGKYVFDNAMFSTLDEALAEADRHDRELAERNRAVREAMGEEPQFPSVPVLIVGLIILVLVLVS